MTRGSAREYLAAIRLRYFRSARQAKSQLLREAIAVTGYHPKHILRLLHHPPRSTGDTRHRPITYGPDVIAALRVAWEACGGICSRRLHPFLPELVRVLGRTDALQLPTPTQTLLLRMSRATIDRVLTPYRRAQRPRGVSTTKPGTLLLSQIPIRTFAQWDDARPGFLETDLVAHCGPTPGGEFVHTVSAVDIATGWWEAHAVLNRSQRVVFAGLEEIRHRLPVPLLGLDSDNDSAFINHHLLAYCRRERITFTRCRPYRKNDQAHIEQKNWSVIRRLIGYDRYEGTAAVSLLNTIYQRLRLYVNFFQPSMKLVGKTRRGAQVYKTYDRAQTPYQRLLASGSLAPDVTQRLADQYARLAPIALRQELEHLLDKLLATGSSVTILMRQRISLR